MFSSRRIITATQLIKNFKKIAKDLQETPHPYLITQKSGHFLVLVEAEVFESMLLRDLEDDIS